jgi:hypothetical protein
MSSGHRKFTAARTNQAMHPLASIEESEAMLVNIVQFPKIKEGKDTEFRQWFADSNRAYGPTPVSWTVEVLGSGYSV